MPNVYSLSQDGLIKKAPPSQIATNSGSSQERVNKIATPYCLGFERTAGPDSRTESLLNGGAVAVETTESEGLCRQEEPLISISLLPLELLISIFLHATRFDIFSPYPRLHILAQVCKVWARIVKSTPDLWSVVNNQRPASEWTTALRLSGLSLIDIHVKEQWNSDTIWPALLQNAYRWRSAHISGLSKSKLSALEDGSAPLLEKLVLDVPQPQMLDATQTAAVLQGLAVMYPPRLVLDLFKGGAPRLSHLKLDSIALRSWDSSILSRLRVLKINKVGSHGPTLQQVFDVLSACPGLEELVLHDLEVKNPKSASCSIIHLPCLEYISLLRLPTTVVCRIMSTIQIPRCTDVYIRGRSSDRKLKSNRIFLSITSAISPAFQAFIASGQIKVSLQVGIYPFITLFLDFRLTKPGYRILLEDVATIAEYSEWTASLLTSGSKISVVCISEVVLALQDDFHNGGQDPAGHIVSLIRLLPHIERLYVYDGELDTLWDAMSIVQVADGSGWLCPNLRTIHLKEHYRPKDPERLVTMLEVRERTAALRRDSGIESDGPAPLERFEIDAGAQLTKTAFERIQNVLGDAFVLDGAVAGGRG
ncbi:hypothetical protein FRB95_013518 [Tulasnella sp. JGI-2019a]|nr:hypothetical protein FRB95_013518 [Tulasnella sp. JGI-2019a]